MRIFVSIFAIKKRKMGDFFNMINDKQFSPQNYIIREIEIEDCFHSFPSYKRSETVCGASDFYHLGRISRYYYEE